MQCQKSVSAAFHFFRCHSGVVAIFYLGKKDFQVSSHEMKCLDMEHLYSAPWPWPFPFNVTCFSPVVNCFIMNLVSAWNSRSPDNPPLDYPPLDNDPHDGTPTTIPHSDKPPLDYPSQDNPPLGNSPHDYNPLDNQPPEPIGSLNLDIRVGRWS